MADHGAADGWDVIVSPWHLDEHIPAFPVPVGAAETICPSLPDGPVPSRMTLLHRAVAAAVARLTPGTLTPPSATPLPSARSAACPPSRPRSPPPSGSSAACPFTCTLTWT
jgi:hypothetical protein